MKLKIGSKRKALNAWAKGGYRAVVLSLVPGFGKSRCGVLAVCHIIDNLDTNKTNFA